MRQTRIITNVSHFTKTVEEREKKAWKWVGRLIVIAFLVLVWVAHRVDNKEQSRPASYSCK